MSSPTTAPHRRMHALLDAIERAHAEAMAAAGDLHGPEREAARRIVTEMVCLKRAAKGLALVSGRIQPAEIEAGKAGVRPAKKMDEIVEALEAEFGDRLVLRPRPLPVSETMPLEHIGDVLHRVLLDEPFSRPVSGPVCASSSPSGGSGARPERVSSAPSGSDPEARAANSDRTGEHEHPSR